MKAFYSSECFECYYIHPQELTTVCGCTALFRCVLVYWCGSAGVGWYLNASEYVHSQELTTVCGCTALFRCVLVYCCASLLLEVGISHHFMKNTHGQSPLRSLLHLIFSQYLLHVHVSNPRSHLQEDGCNQYITL